MPRPPRARSVLLALAVLTIVLGAWSVRAIQRAAGRRASLVDGLAASVPVSQDARVLVDWQPVADVDLAHTTLCFDDATEAAVVAGFARALAEAHWQVSSVAAAPGPGPVDADGDGGGAGAPSSGRAGPAVTASSARYRLRGTIEPARRVDCDAARNQVLLSIEAAPR
jgi:hypothetical protein